MEHTTEVTNAVATVQSEKPEVRAYKVWMSAESTINTTVEVEAASAEEALEKARDMAEEQIGHVKHHGIEWYYEGSGDVLLDPVECWSADVLPKPLTMQERLQRQIEGVFSANRAERLLFVRHGRDIRVFAGASDVTTAIANATRMATNRDKRTGVVALAEANTANLAARISELLGREVKWGFIG